MRLEADLGYGGRRNREENATKKALHMHALIFSDYFVAVEPMVLAAETDYLQNRPIRVDAPDLLFLQNKLNKALVIMLNTV